MSTSRGRRVSSKPRRSPPTKLVAMAYPTMIARPDLERVVSETRGWLLVLRRGLRPGVLAPPWRRRHRSEGSGWVAYSAYGLQLSVPISWTVASFQSSPLRDFGNPAHRHTRHCELLRRFARPVQTSCGMSHRVARPVSRVTPYTLVIGGLGGRPTAGCAGDFAATALGDSFPPLLSSSATVPRTRPCSHVDCRHLDGASRSRMLRGSEYLVALATAHGHGDDHGDQVRFGKSSEGVPRLRRGVLGDASSRDVRVVGHAGDAPCPPVTVTVRSGETTEAPESTVRASDRSARAGVTLTRGGCHRGDQSRGTRAPGPGSAGELAAGEAAVVGHVRNGQWRRRTRLGRGSSTSASPRPRRTSPNSSTERTFGPTLHRHRVLDTVTPSRRSKRPNSVAVR